MLVSFVFKQSEKKRSLFRRGGIAQLAEQSPFKRLVQGSSPCAPTLRQAQGVIHPAICLVRLTYSLLTLTVLFAILNCK